MTGSGLSGGGAVLAALALAACLLMTTPTFGVTPGTDDGAMYVPSGSVGRTAPEGPQSPPAAPESGRVENSGRSVRSATPPSALTSMASVDLSTDKDIFVYGEDAGDETGSAMATGDIDGDGKDDFVLGAPLSDGAGDSRMSAGQVHIKFGDTRTSLGAAIDMWGDDDAMYYGATAGDKAGFSLAVADLDGDGKDDVIIGAPEADGPGDARLGCGEVYVIYGDTQANMAGDHDLGTAADAKIMGKWSGGKLGSAVAVGDVIGTTDMDLVMGAPNAESAYGAVYVADGEFMPASRDFSSSAANLTITGNATGDDFGAAVACGDVDDDGKDDILAGAPAKFVKANSVGAAYLILGGALATPLNLNTTAPDMYMPGVSSQGYAGLRVDMGDIDGDGKDDMVVTAPGAMGGGARSGSGEVYINFGNATLPSVRNLHTESNAVVWGAGNNDNLGSAVALGDVEADGRADLLMGANNADGPGNTRNNCGEGYLLFGGSQSLINGSLDLAAGDAQHTFFGIETLDEAGSSAAIGDLDGDGFDEVMLSAAYGDGHNNGRSDSGEMYVIFGETLTIYNVHCVLVDGYKGTKEVFAGYKAYTLEVNVTERRGPSHLSNVTITLGVGAADTVYNWTSSGNFFTEVNDTSSVSAITADSFSASDGVMTVSLSFNLTFNWTWPSEAAMTVSVVSVSDLGVNDTTSFTQVFQVENDLDLTGTLTAESHVRGGLTDGDWVGGGENITMGNLTAVYEGTTDVYPFDSDFNIMVKNDDGDVWMDNTSAGGAFEVNVTSNPDSDPEDVHTVKIVNISGNGQDVSSAGFTIKVDADGPGAPQQITIRADYANDPEVYADDDTGVFVTWYTADDGPGSGVAQHYMAYDDDRPVSPNASGDPVIVSEGEPVVWVRARDNVGNWGEAANDTIIVDLKELAFSDFSPADTVWVTSLTDVTVNVTITDLGLAGIDGSTIAYTRSTDGPEGFTSWTASPSPVDGPGLNVSAQTSFAEGTDNYFKWKASDLAGNGETESEAFNIKVDVTKVEFGEYPEETLWHRSNSVDCEITVTDEFSGVYAGSIAYKYSTEGEDSYGEWTDDGLVLTEVEGGYRCSVPLNLPDGDDNYVRWLARDVARTGKALSEPVNYLVDTGLVRFSNLRPANEPWLGSEKVTIRAALSDPTSGVDPGTIAYAIGEGPNLFGPWQNARVDEGGKLVDAVTTATLSEGSDHYIKWRARDVAGNDINESRAYNIRVDLTPPAYAALTPSPGTVQHTTPVICGILVKDDFGSGVNRSTIQYSYSTSGTGGYGGWIDADIIPAIGDERYQPYWVEADVPFIQGTGNYIRWRAMDMVGNDYSVSDDLMVEVNLKSEDEPPDIVISSPPVDSGDAPVYKSGTRVLLDADNSTDPEGGALSFYWESDIDGGLGSEGKVTRELTPGTHNITLWVDDGTDGHNRSHRFQVKILEPDVTDGGEPQDGGDGIPDGGGGEEGPEKEGEDECGMLGMGCVAGIPIFILLIIILLIVAAAGAAAMASSRRKAREEEEKRKAGEEEKKKKEEEEEKARVKALAVQAAWTQQANAGGAYVGMAGGAPVPAGYQTTSGAAVKPLPVQVGYVPPAGNMRPYSHPGGPALQLPATPYADAAQGVRAASTGADAAPGGTGPSVAQQTPGPVVEQGHASTGIQASPEPASPQPAPGSEPGGPGQSTGAMTPPGEPPAPQGQSVLSGPPT